MGGVEVVFELIHLLKVSHFHEYTDRDNHIVILSTIIIKSTTGGKLMNY